MELFACQNLEELRKEIESKKSKHPVVSFFNLYANFKYTKCWLQENLYKDSLVHSCTTFWNLCFLHLSSVLSYPPIPSAPSSDLLTKLALQGGDVHRKGTLTLHTIISFKFLHQKAVLRSCILTQLPTYEILEKKLRTTSKFFSNSLKVIPESGMEFKSLLDCPGWS